MRNIEYESAQQSYCSKANLSEVLVVSKPLTNNLESLFLEKFELVVTLRRKEEGVHMLVEDTWRRGGGGVGERLRAS